MQAQNIIDDATNIISVLAKDVASLVVTLTTRQSNGCMPFEILCMIKFFAPFAAVGIFVYCIIMFFGWYFSGVSRVLSNLEKLQTDIDELKKVLLTNKDAECVVIRRHYSVR
jgi:hypothetical protein